MRKWFHLLALAVYTPCIVLDPPFLSLAAALAMLTFLAVEVCLSVPVTRRSMEEEEVEEQEEEEVEEQEEEEEINHPHIKDSYQSVVISLCLNNYWGVSLPLYE